MPLNPENFYALQMMSRQPSSYLILQVTEEDLEPYLAQVRDKALKHALQYGVGFLYETMPAVEKEVVNRLFASGAIQVIFDCTVKCRAGQK